MSKSSAPGKGRGGGENSSFWRLRLTVGFCWWVLGVEGFRVYGVGFGGLGLKDFRVSGFRALGFTVLGVEFRLLAFYGSGFGD